MHPPGRVSTSGGFPRSLPLSPSRPNRDALCATKHLARASSCLYVAAYSPSLPRLSLLFPSVLDSLSFSLSPPPPPLPLFLSLSSSFLLLSFHPHVRQASRYPWISSGRLPLRFKFLTRFPSQISLPPCPFRCTLTISSKRCSVIRHGFRESTNFCFFYPL